MNWIAVIVAALIPMVIGFIWYNPKLFGNAWMKAAGMTEEKMKGGNMPVIFGVSFILSLLLALQMHTISIHQFNLDGLFNVGGQMPAPDSEDGKFLADFHAKYDGLHRTFQLTVWYMEFLQPSFSSSPFWAPMPFLSAKDGNTS